MSKIYEALRQAELDRAQRAEKKPIAPCKPDRPRPSLMFPTLSTLPLIPVASPTPSPTTPSPTPTQRR